MNAAEQGVIGCVLIDNNSLYDVYNKLKPEMFASEFAQDCYAEMIAMYDRGENVNILSLSQALENRKLDHDDIRACLKDCISSTPTSVMMKSYADSVIKMWRSRKANELFYHISFSPKDIDNTISEVLARLEELQANKEVSSKSLKQIVKENKENYFNENVGKNLVKTGFYKLDDCLGGLEGGDITIIGACPGVGKSAIVTQIIGQMAKKGYRVGYFNLEMNESQVYERFVSRLAELSLTRVRRAKSFLGGEEEAFNKANEEMAGYDVIISTGSKSVSEVKAESRHQRFDVIVIDYLQLIKADSRYANRASEVGDISKSIKGMASELHVPIILLSQLNRVSESKETKEPTMAELRESGDIEQDASNIILMWNVSDKNRSFKGLKVEKQRQGETMKEGLQFDGEHMSFRERQESFDKFISFVKSMDKGDGFQSVGDDESPFEGW